MKNLDTERINEYAPYKVEMEAGQYIFETDNDILLYMCDSANNQQAQRSRLFLYWFNAYGRQAEYYTCTEMVKDGDEENYIALIVKRDHPQLQMIIDVFNKQIAMFRTNKPQ